MRRIAFFILCTVLLVFSGCDKSGYNANYSNNDWLARDEDSYVKVQSAGLWVDNEYNLTATLTGTDTVWSYSAKEDHAITLTYSLSVTTGGSAKLVWIAPDNTVMTLVENLDQSGGNLQAQTIICKKGRNRIKIVGQNDPKLELYLMVDEKGATA